jgi:lipopolysaccharide/colanic/teichoic acid biosynthesis glycosyltransferase
MWTRALDVLLSGVALLCFLPFLLVIAAVLRFSGEGEILYRQERVGMGGKPFGLLKFATMLKDSPNIGAGLLTLQNDPRVLPIGRFLRRGLVALAQALCATEGLSTDLVQNPSVEAPDLQGNAGHTEP